MLRPAQRFALLSSSLSHGASTPAEQRQRRLYRMASPPLLQLLYRMAPPRRAGVAGCHGRGPGRLLASRGPGRGPGRLLASRGPGRGPGRLLASRGPGRGPGRLLASRGPGRGPGRLLASRGPGRGVAACQVHAV
jgi:hypothetical protein